MRAACDELRDRLEHDSYLRDRVRGVQVHAARKALYRCEWCSVWRRCSFLVSGCWNGRAFQCRVAPGRPRAKEGPLYLHAVVWFGCPRRATAHTCCTGPLCRCSCWKKLQDAGRPAKDVRDIAQLRVTIDPRASGAASLDYCTDKQL